MMVSCETSTESTSVWYVIGLAQFRRTGEIKATRCYLTAMPTCLSFARDQTHTKQKCVQEHTDGSNSNHGKQLCIWCL